MRTIKQALEDAYSTGQGGMLAGLPKVTVDAAELLALVRRSEAQAKEIEEWEEKWAKEFALRGHETAQLERRIADQNAEIARLEELVRESANQLSNL